MALQILTNELYRDCADTWLAQVDSIASPTTLTKITEQDNVINVTAGARHLEKTVATAGKASIAYVDDGGALAFNTLVVTKANRWATQTLSVSVQTAYGGAFSVLFSTTNFAETLVGPNSDVWVYVPGSAQTAKEVVHLNLESTATRIFGKIYGCNAYSLTYPGTCTITPLERNFIYRTPRGRAYRCDQRIVMQFGALTDAEYDSFSNLFEIYEHPCFVYDSDEAFVPHKLNHVIFRKTPIERRFNDVSNITLEMFRLWDQ